MFGGTLGAIGGIRPAARFEMELEDPVMKRARTTMTALVSILTRSAAQKAPSPIPASAVVIAGDLMARRPGGPDLPPGTVMFGGTLGAIGGIRPAASAS
jgi:hypothetical protein